MSQTKTIPADGPNYTRNDKKSEWCTGRLQPTNRETSLVGIGKHDEDYYKKGKRGSKYRNKPSKNKKIKNKKQHHGNWP